jgi:hypothetical protein
MKSKRLRIATGVAAGAAVLVATVAWGTPAHISTGAYKIPVTAQFNVAPKACDNRTSDIDISGELSFPGVGVDIRFQNQDNNLSPGAVKHTKEVATTASFTIYDFAVNSLPKQPVRGGVGGNPRIYVLLKDDQGNYISDPIYVGRCVTGNSYKSGKYTAWLDADASAILTSLTCDQKGGPFVDIGTEGNHDGLDADVIFTNNAKFTHATDPYAAKIALTLSPPLHERKGGGVNGGGVTGNPLLSARFHDHNGVPMQDYIPLGRCNQLGA